MSVEAISIAINHSRSTGIARLVLIGIANHDGDGGSYPSIARLTRYAGGIPRDASVIRRALRELEELGEIRREIQAGGDRNTPEHARTNLYEFLLTCPPECDGSKRHNLVDQLTGESVKDLRLGWLETSSVDPAPVDNLGTPGPTGPGVGRTPGSGAPRTHRSSEPSLKPPVNNKSSSETTHLDEPVDKNDDGKSFSRLSRWAGRWTRKRAAKHLDVARLKRELEAVFTSGDGIDSAELERIVYKIALTILARPATAGTAVEDPTAYVIAAVRREPEVWRKRAFALEVTP